MGKKRKTYDKEFKYKAVRMYLDEDYGYKRVIEELDIPDTRILRRWVNNYKQLGMEGLEERRGKAASLHKGRPRVRPLSLEEENKRLKAEIEFLKKLRVLQEEVKRKTNKITMFFTIIQELSSMFPVMLLCEIAGVTRGGYYKWLNRLNNKTQKQQEDDRLKEFILACHEEVKGIYGYYRIQIWLRRKHGIHVNHKRVYRLMKELGIQANIRKKKRYFNRKSEKVVTENKLNREFKATKPNEKWVTDITYLIFNNHKLYLSTIYDLFNSEIVAYKISERNDLKLVTDTVNLAVKKRDVTGTLLHSDQGFQYTSHKYNKLLKTYNIKQSMSRKANCLDNACMENFFGHLKSELMYTNSFKTKDEVILAVKKYIHFYNTERYQRKLNNLSPIEYRTKVCA